MSAIQSDQPAAELGPKRPCACRRFRSLILPVAIVAVAMFTAYLASTKGLMDGNSFKPPIIPGVPYAADVQSEQTAFDLEFSPNRRYLVVVGSLGQSNKTFSVECSAEPIALAELGPFHRVESIAEHIRDSSVGWASEPLSDDVAGRLAVDQRAFGQGQGGRLHEAGPPNDEHSATRSFSLHVGDGNLDDPRQYVTIHARPVREGREVRIYLDDQQSDRELAPQLLATLTDLFDREVIPRFRKTLGTYRDIDQDGRFTVLLSPWLGRLQGGRTSLGGFVRGSDFQRGLKAPFSNHCDMMYVNSSIQPGPHLRTLLIHEFTHAVCFSRRVIDEGSGGQSRLADEEDWLNEAIAHCAEDVLNGGWSNLDYRIARFLNDPSAFPLVVEDYYRAGLWRCHGCRGATYLFLRYCVDSFGPEILGQIVTNPSHGARNVEQVTRSSFESLFRGWTLAMLDSKPPIAEAGEHGAGEFGSSNSADAATDTLRPSLSPLDLYGSIGAWGLAGPRRQPIDVDRGTCRVNLKGTTAAYLELHASGPPGPRRIRFAGDPHSSLQVSLIRLPDDVPQLGVVAKWVESRPSHVASIARIVAAGAADTPQETRCLHVTVQFEQGEDLKVEQLSVEQNAAETRNSVCFRGASLAERADDRGGARNDGQARVYQIPLKRFTASNVAWIVKVVASDRNGRRTSAWTRIDASGGDRSGEELAKHSP